MAIIKCPECGGQISSTVKNCVHCGCKITVCPDCGKIYVGDVKNCTGCGANLSGESLPVNTVKQENDKLEWRMNNDKKTQSRISKICDGIELVGIIFFIAVIIYGNFKREDLLLAYLNGESWNFESWRKLLLFSGVFAVACVIVAMGFKDISSYYIKKRGVQWLKAENIDYKNYLYTHLHKAINATEISGCCYNLTNTAFYLENENEFKSLIAKIIIKLLCVLACFISATVWVVNNFDELFIAIELGIQYDFNFNVPSFYCAIIFFCLVYISIFVFWLIRSRRQKAWEIKRKFN